MPSLTCWRSPPLQVACLDMNLQKNRMMMGVQVLVSDPAELEKIRQVGGGGRGVGGTCVRESVCGP